LHICYFENNYPNQNGEGGGGAGWYLKTLSKELVNLGHQVTIIKRTINQRQENYIDENGVRIIHSHAFLLPYYYLSKIPVFNIFSHSIAYIIASWSGYKKIVKLNNQLKFDILEFTESGNFWIGFFKRFKYISHLHCSNYTALKQSGEKIPINYKLERFISFISMKRASYIIAPSKAMISIVESESGKQFIKTAVIPLCIERTKSKTIFRNDDSVRFVFASRNDPLKGGDSLIKAIQLVNKNISVKVEFYFIGYKPSKGDSLPSNIILNDFLPRQELLKFYSKCDVALLPSLFDNSPLFIYETMATGLPVIATNVGGIPELVKHGETGFLFEANDINRLASHINTLIENPLKRKQMGKNAKKFIYNYASVDKIAKQKLRLYRNIIGENNQGAI
jgi:glycosyltransferase involved in cell wall biosynthesis